MAIAAKRAVKDDETRRPVPCVEDDFSHEGLRMDESFTQFESRSLL